MPRINPYEVEMEYTEEELKEIEIQRENDLVANEEAELNLIEIRNNCFCGKCLPDWLGLGSISSSKHEKTISS